ncbi:MAG: HAMP domain-containing protein [Planctomycetota bacterium]|nr:MAG: HAMP domain-containing protein [Planctomycetota bacterium]
MIRSLRWRLQAWHAVVLTAVLSIFGMVVYHLLWQTRIDQIDSELHRTAEVLTSRLRRLLPAVQMSRWRPPMELPEVLGREWLQSLNTSNEMELESEVIQRPPSAPASDDEQARGSSGVFSEQQFGQRPFPPEIPRPESMTNLADEHWLPEDFVTLFEGVDAPLYYIVWDRDGVILQRSDFAPQVKFENLYKGWNSLPVRTVQSRGWLREVTHCTSFGNHVLVGRSIQGDVASQHGSGWLLAACGWLVLTLGVVGGGWLSGRALRPLASMSVTAKNISVENISQRIDLAETDSELGQLALVLNQTFDRLQSAFEHQLRFTADASHELRTPLAVILSQTELTLSKPRSSDEYRTALETCQRAGRRMRSLIDSLLLLARFDAGHPELQRGSVDLAEVANESVELLRPLADERKITLRSEVLPMSVVGDRDRLGQVVTNLLANAIRYNQEGGHVEVRVERVNGHAIVSVSDNGIGIPTEELPHIFERFYRVDKARTRVEGGTGLGLAICQSVVEAHGGQITARSEPEHGTTLEVRLPLPPETGKDLQNPGYLVAASSFHS